MSKRIDRTGQVYGRLTALAFVSQPISSWLCRCWCGNTCVVRTSDLRLGKTKSCGCGVGEAASKRMTTHGATKGRKRTPEYVCWAKMLERCRQNSKNANVYYDRGIVVCERWLQFENFLADMGTRPTGTSVDRVNNGLGYFPGNCRWATQKQQCRNLRKNILLTHDGVTKCLPEWAEELKVPYSRLQMRYYLGWSVQDILFKPARISSRVYNQL